MSGLGQKEIVDARLLRGINEWMQDEAELPINSHDLQCPGVHG